MGGGGGKRGGREGREGREGRARHLVVKGIIPGEARGRVDLDQPGAQIFVDQHVEPEQLKAVDAVRDHILPVHNTTCLHNRYQSTKEDTHGMLTCTQ